MRGEYPRFEVGPERGPKSKELAPDICLYDRVSAIAEAYKGHDDALERTASEVTGVPLDFDQIGLCDSYNQTVECGRCGLRLTFEAYIGSIDGRPTEFTRYEIDGECLFHPENEIETALD